MKVVLSQFEGIDYSQGLPLASGCLVATARRDPRLAGAKFEIHTRRRAVASAAAALGDADVLGFSLYPWNAAYGLEVAAAARRARPDALIVAGGPSVPRRPASSRRFLDENPQVDVLVFAEGEVAFRELLAARRAGASLDAIPGLAYRTAHGGADYAYTPPPVRVFDLTQTASPYLDGTFDALIDGQRERFTSAVLETNRGCPFSCTFCDWSLTKHVEEFPLERVDRELEWIAAHGFDHVILCDANFGIRKRDHDIARRLAAIKKRTGKPRLCYFYLTKNDHLANLGTLEILNEAGIGCSVGLAVQDFDDGVLEAVKRDNIQSGESQRLREICAARGIPTLNELIFGLPKQTEASFARTIVEAMPPYPKHTFQVFQCRLLDNTEMASPESRAEHGIETRRCIWRSPLQGFEAVIDEHQELVVATKDLPLDAWRRTYRFVYLASAAYNFRLLRVVLQYLQEALGQDLAPYLQHLSGCLVSAAPGTVLAELAGVFDLYTGSILASGAFTLTLPLTGDAPLDVVDALTAVALSRPDDFYSEVRAVTRGFLESRQLDTTLVDELFRFQSLLVVRHGQTEPVTLDLAHDWPHFAATGGAGAPPIRRPTRARFVPPAYAGLPDFGQLATVHAACARAGASLGELIPEGPRRLALV